MTLAVGFFDGVHLGHRAILHGADVAVTFMNHPLSVLHPQISPRLLMPSVDKEKMILESGVARVEMIDFTKELSKVSPEDFIERLVRDAGESNLTIRCGSDWRFGRCGLGDAQYLKKLGFNVQVADYVFYEGTRISSTRIRKAIEEGDLGSANAMLGRMFSVSGKVERGKGLGRKIGFPTVNVVVDGQDGDSSLVEPPSGVYAVNVAGCRAVANWGIAPTLGEKAWKRRILEVHFLDAPPETVGRVTVQLKTYIRPERRFASIDELKKQIALDIEQA